MGVVPKVRIDRIQFYEAHAPVWLEEGAAIGVSGAEATLLAERAAEARESYMAALRARDAAQAATDRYHQLTASMSAYGSALMSKIRGFAEVTDDIRVYSRAQIPPPAPAAPAPPPGKPNGFSINLLQTGTLVLRWKCANPASTFGTIYEVRRRIGNGELTFVGTTGVKSFTDHTIPAGSTGIVYQITAVRSTRRGQPAQFNVNFGTDESAVSAREMKMAA